MLCPDTGRMNGEKTPPEESLWQKTQFANLVRYIPSGIYFARFRVRGKLIRKSPKEQFDVCLRKDLRLKNGHFSLTLF